VDGVFILNDLLKVAGLKTKEAKYRRRDKSAVLFLNNILSYIDGRFTKLTAPGGSPRVSQTVISG